MNQLHMHAWASRTITSSMIASYFKGEFPDAKSHVKLKSSGDWLVH